jgi:hypothetical protein
MSGVFYSIADAGGLPPLRRDDANPHTGLVDLIDRRIKLTGNLIRNSDIKIIVTVETARPFRHLPEVARLWMLLRLLEK